MLQEILLCEFEAFPMQIMVSVAISKAGKTSIFFVQPNAEVNAKYYCNVLLKEIIPEMNKLTRYNDYLLMQGGDRGHTAKLTLEMLKDKKQLRLLEPHHWPPNSPDLNPVDFGIWGLLEQNVTKVKLPLGSLKEAIGEEWNKISQEIIDKCIDAFKPELWRSAYRAILIINISHEYV